MNKYEIIKKVLLEENITEFGIVKSDDLFYQKPYLLKNKEIYKSCIVLCIPYKTKNNNAVNISKYAAVYDYHLYFKMLYENLSNKFNTLFINEQFIGFSDHSPINERDAAIKAGLGMIGMNSMLINPKYGSFIFIGSIFTTLELETVSHDITACERCGKCIDACPTGALVNGFDKCLSFITQKKNKTEEDIQTILKNESVWGCDICQDVCPYNKNAEYSPIPFFHENIINYLTTSIINDMDDKEFEKRAFSWRGRKTILENLSLSMNKKQQ